MKTYMVKEMFRTLQGEGFFVGQSAVFLRFTGCNLWSGNERGRNNWARGTGAACPRFCDTDFVGGDKMVASGIASRCAFLGAGENTIVVATGGEPMLQLDFELTRAIHGVGAKVHVETNGTISPGKDTMESIDWVTLSPKVRPEMLRVRSCDELKVVVPSYSPKVFEGAVDAVHLFVQPEDGPNKQANTDACVKFIEDNPQWRLSVQTHKENGFP